MTKNIVGNPTSFGINISWSMVAYLLVLVNLIKSAL